MARLNWFRKFFQLCFCGIFFNALIGCAVLDPQHVLTRQMGNAAPASGLPLSHEQKQEAYDFVWQRVNDAYVDPNFNGVDWRSAGQQHYPRIMAAKTDDLFWRNLDDMVAELGDAHTRVLSAKQYANDKEKKSYSLGLNVVNLDGEVVVVGIAKDSAAEKSEIVVGDKVLSIDGASANDWWQVQRQKARKNSTERAREKSVRRILNGGDPEIDSDEIRLVLETAKGVKKEVSLQRRVLNRKDTLSSNILAENLGYLKLTGFDQKLDASLAEHFAKLQNTRGLIVDLRGNGGGSLGLALAMMNYLVRDKVAIGERKTRSGKPPAFLFGLVSMGTLKLELVGKRNPYLKPLVVLVDSDSASASEFFSGSLQAIGRANVIGTTTCGCLLGYMGYANIPGGGGLAYSEMDFVPVAGKRIEGVGVVPNQTIRATRADLIANRDVVLQAAIEALNTAASSPTQENTQVSMKSVED